MRGVGWNALSSWRAVVAVTAALVTQPAAAAVDVTGRWIVTFDHEPYIHGPWSIGLRLSQESSEVTWTDAVGLDWRSIPQGLTADMIGTIDPLTGAMHFEREPMCAPPTEPLLSLDVVVAPTSATFSGTYYDQVIVAPKCFQAAGTVTGTRVLDTCGNGTVEFGETCDGGPCCTEFCRLRDAGSACPASGLCAVAACDGLGSCVETAKSAGTVCRPADRPCDTAEVCDGTSLACPQASSPTEDADGDGTPDVCDDCVGQPLEMVRLRVGRFGTASGPDFLTLRARVRLSADVSLPDPAETVKEIVLRDALGNVVVAGVAAGAGGRWRRKGRRWLYRNDDASDRTVSRMTIAPVDDDPHAWKVELAMRRLSLDGTSSLPPVGVLLGLDALAAPSTSCGEQAFGGPGTPVARCSGPNRRGIIRCR